MNKGKIVRYLICFIVTALVIFFYARSYDFASLDIIDKYRVLSDSFFCATALFGVVSALIFVSNNGGFDEAGFLWQKLKKRSTEETDNYLEYIHNQNRVKIDGYGYLLVMAILNGTISLLFLCLYHHG